MKEINLFSVLMAFSLYTLVLNQTQLSSCDYNKYKVNGCEDELGSECDTTTNMCRCKGGNWFVIDKRFCFPTQCPRGQYYDHNMAKCESQRKATLNSEENYCKHDFHCRGDYVQCLHVNEWNYRCVCNQGFLYDTTTQECQKIEGLNGFCSSDMDCDKSVLRHLVCVDKSCQCAHGFTYNTNIDGCEDNKDIAERDSQTRKIMYLFIGLGLFFGAALSLKFTNSTASAQQMLLKQVIERRQKERDQRRQQINPQTEQGDNLQQETAINLESNDNRENLIDKRETA